jgi:hypothetical protein
MTQKAKKKLNQSIRTQGGGDEMNFMNLINPFIHGPVAQA